MSCRKAISFHSILSGYMCCSCTSALQYNWWNCYTLSCNTLSLCWTCFSLANWIELALIFSGKLNKAQGFKTWILISQILNQKYAINVCKKDERLVKCSTCTVLNIARRFSCRKLEDECTQCNKVKTQISLYNNVSYLTSKNPIKLALIWCRYPFLLCWIVTCIMFSGLV